MQRTQIKQSLCRECGTATKFERHVTAMGVGDLFLALLSGGLWLLVRFAFRPAYRCSVCGSK